MTKRLDIGGTLSGVFDLYGKQAGVLLPAAAVIFIPIAVLAVIIGLVLGGAAGAPEVGTAPTDFGAPGAPMAPPDVNTGALVGAGIAGLVIGLLQVTAVLFYAGVVAKSVEDMRDGRRDLGVGDLLRQASPVLGKLFLLALLFILVGIVLSVVFALLSAVLLPLIPLWVLLLLVALLVIVTWWYLSPAVVAIEQTGPATAVARSRELVRGYFWHVLLVIVVIGIIGAVAQFILSALFGLGGPVVAQIGSVIGSILVAPLAGLAIGLMYFQLRGDSSPAGSAPAPGAPPQPPAAPTV